MFDGGRETTSAWRARGGCAARSGASSAASRRKAAALEHRARACRGGRRRARGDRRSGSGSATASAAARCPVERRDRQRCAEMLERGARRSLGRGVDPAACSATCSRWPMSRIRRATTTAAAARSYEELGMAFALAARAVISARIELMAGDLDAAERAAPLGVRAARARSARTEVRSTIGGYPRAGAVRAGPRRRGRGDSRASEELAAAEDDVYSQVLWRSALAKVLRPPGRRREARRRWPRRRSGSPRRPTAQLPRLGACSTSPAWRRSSTGGRAAARARRGGGRRSSSARAMRPRCVASALSSRVPASRQARA